MKKTVLLILSLFVVFTVLSCNAANTGKKAGNKAALSSAKGEMQAANLILDKKINVYVCGKCGFVSFKGAPENCPICGAPQRMFSINPNAINKPVDTKNLNELEKLHIPVIVLNKECKLVGPGCVDANVKIGSTLHVMEISHYIRYIDIYHDYKFIGRYQLTPGGLNPAVGVHLKATTGQLLILENCNLHGRWIAEIKI